MRLVFFLSAIIIALYSWSSEFIIYKLVQIFFGVDLIFFCGSRPWMIVHNNHWIGKVLLLCSIKSIKRVVVATLLLCNSVKSFTLLAFPWLLIWGDTKIVWRGAVKLIFKQIVRMRSRFVIIIYPRTVLIVQLRDRWVSIVLKLCVLWLILVTLISWGQISLS